ncbi:MAG: hypothetical protein RIG61_02145 [Deltaproteobacteria bacterium]
MIAKKFSVFALILLTLTVFFFSCGSDNKTDERWKYVGGIKGEKEQTISVYMDMSNIEIDDNKRKFWIKYMDFKKDGSAEQYIRQTGYWEVDCFDRNLFRLGEEYYGPDNQLLGRSEERVKEESASSESLGAKMADVACRYAGR